LEYAQKQQEAAGIDSTIPINPSGKDKRINQRFSSGSI
jgi:hypothetical protein